ncbi:hypothetical protein AK830_g5886 [Neonectria ditissima]|uniref:Uncharacterized protein n=1 Tax=Neonectria ditissima TaxID=78410 RepID=A0A0P7B2Q5_9HYPO|nr:hypothetical protein AK830_g5886 [Neonectria ditissima]
MASLLPQTLPTHPTSWYSTSSSPDLNFDLDTFAPHTTTTTKSPRRFPQNFPPSLPILPYTAAEWARTIQHIKREYFNHRYRPCATRCNDILDNLRDASVVQPAYLIYLHFYAASAQETMAHGLHNASSARVDLLHQAQDHYQQASHLIASADASMNQSLQRESAVYDFGDSPTSILSFPASAFWSPSVMSRGSSRASSISSQGGSDLDFKPGDQAPLDAVSEDGDVLIRPDSPTLGLPSWVDSSFRDILDAMPSPPTSPARESESPPLPCLPERTSDHVHSAFRYAGLLAGLQGQAVRHLAFIEIELEAARNPPPTAANLGLLHHEHRALDLQARVEKLRAGGWQRRRFNSRRYEELRESAMADMFK